MRIVEAKVVDLPAASVRRDPKIEQTGVRRGDLEREGYLRLIVCRVASLVLEQ